jgi:4-hydroxy-3-polyprenylbenzoate decarboxylase
MAYSNLEECLLDLERTGQLLRIKEEVDPNLEMAAIHLRIHEQKGPAILFEKVKGSKFRAASNIFGTLERSQFIFRHTLPVVKQLIDIKIDPASALKHPIKSLGILPAALTALPKKKSNKQAGFISRNKYFRFTINKTLANGRGSIRYFTTGIYRRC